MTTGWSSSFRGGTSLVGTTDTDFEGRSRPALGDAGEVTYLLETVAQALPDRRVALDNVAYTYAGVRPLSFEEGRSASKVSREHKVVAEGPGGRFLSVTGTKLTCFRSLAEEIGDRVMQALGRRAPSRTARLSLDGTDEDVSVVEARAYMDVSEEMAASGLGREVFRRRRHLWPVPAGARAGEEAPDDRTCLSNPEIVAQLHHAVSDEPAVSLQDVLLAHRDRAEPLPGSDCAESIGVRMAELLGWSAPARRRARRLSTARRPKPAF